MSFSNRNVSRITLIIRVLVATLIISAIAVPFSPSQAQVTGADAKLALDSVMSLLREASKSSKRTGTPLKSKQIESPGQREARVASISLCPRRALMYVGEEHIVSPLPLDRSRQPVHGIAFSYESSDKNIADVASDGSVTALKPGECFVTASAGQTRAKVLIEVRDGLRSRLTNAQWDNEHAGECEDPEQDPELSLTQAETQSRRNEGKDPSFVPESLPPPDPDEPTNVPAAGSRFNTTGHPRFSPNLALKASATSNDNQLASSSFNLSIPIYGSSGRRVGTDLNLVYNSRMWTKNPQTTGIIWDYDQGWPAPGFRLNYGWIIRDYDVPSGVLGNYLLVEADGTRTPLINKGGGLYRSDDGRYLQFANHFLTYPDGTLVRYELRNSRLLPIYVKDVNGNSISITYVDRNANNNCSDAQRVEACTCGSGCYAPARQSINYITDTLGRLITFYYYANGHLAEVRAPGYNGAPDRVLAKFYYQTITLQYNFSLAVTGAPGDNQVDVLRRVYLPETGRGYVFDNYSGYGMCTRASMRLGMTDASGGTDNAHTDYVFNTDGQLSDAPQFTQRSEWWQHKTDDSGNDTTLAAVYDYTRTSDSSTMTTTIAGPNNVTTVMVSNNDSSSPQYGLLTEQRIPDGSTVKLKQEFFYDNPSSGSGSSGLQRNKVITTDDGSPTPNQTRTDFLYGQYGRLMTLIEFGFPTSGNFKKRRRTEYQYLNTSAYVNASLLQLVTDMTVWDPNGTPNDDTDDIKVSRTGFEYDTPDSGWEIQKYGLTQGCQSCGTPPGFDTNYVNTNERGLVTKTLSWSDATSTNAADISFRHQYDLFGNEIQAEVGCCSLKRFTFSPNTSGMHYSLPMSATDGPVSGPNLTSSFAYDFNTSFLNSQTDPNSLVTSYLPDVYFTSGGSMRLRKVTYPKLTTDTNANPTLETFFADPSYPNKDGLVYQSKFTYFDGTTQKIQVSSQWLDGAGRPIRTGSAAGASPTSFDAVKSIYDDLGRLRKNTNPYLGDSTGNITGLPNATVYDYDVLSRVLMATLPDSNTMTTTFNGAMTTITDQAGRQRRSEVDGLGRIITVTEMDDSKVLNWATSYGYNLNDNLTSVSQGTQTRAFKYDSLARMTYERTPEQDATINDGSGTFWSAHYTYTSFNAISTRQDARGAVSNYFYDGLNRLYQVGYTLPNPNPNNVQATATVNVTYGSTVPKLGQVEEVKQTDSQSVVPWKENYSYDTLSRVSSKTVSFDDQAYAYTTGYGYNQASQLTQMTYPSTRVVKHGFDDRGRLQKVGDAGSATKYISSTSYQPSQQVGSISLNNGVTENYGYSADRLQLTSQTATKSGNTLMSLTYNYVAPKSRSGGGGTGNANTGQLMDITSSQINGQQRNESYNYDQVARLTQAGGFYAQRNYTYDRWGNRTAMSGGSSQTISYARDANNVPLTNRISSVNSGPSYTYDATGDVTYDAGHSYGYDAESRIVTVDSGSTATYFYDTANRRVKKVAGGYTTYYVWEGSNVIAEYGNAPVGSGGTRFYHPDRLSNRMITDASGVVKGTMDNLPFGEDGGVVGESEKHRFTTYERDVETDSDYAMNRQYSQSTARFGRTDPLSGRQGPQSLNRYSYVSNDPVNSVDPLGLLRVYCFTVTGGPLGTGGDGTVVIGVTEYTFCVIIFEFSSGGIFEEPRGGGGGGKRQSKPPPIACPLDPSSLRVPNGRAPGSPWSRANPPETMTPRAPQGPQFPEPVNTKPITTEPVNPRPYPGFNPNEPMPPQDPSFWWKARFVGTEILRIGGSIFKGVGSDVVVMVKLPNCLYKPGGCNCTNTQNNTMN